MNHQHMCDFSKNLQQVLEINPLSPLTVEVLLHWIQAIPAEQKKRDIEAEDELREISTALVNGTFVRFAFAVPDSNEETVSALLRCSVVDRLRDRLPVDRIRRRSLGVSETTPADGIVKNAPPQDSSQTPTCPTSMSFSERAREGRGEVEEIDKSATL